MSGSKALPAQFYSRDPSESVDLLRKVERRLGGCDGCRHDVTMIGLRGCVAGGKVNNDGYCAKRGVK